MQALEARASETAAVLADSAKKALLQLAAKGDTGLAEAERLLAMADEVSARAAGVLADAGKLVERMVRFVSKVSAFLDILVAAAARAAGTSGGTDGPGASNTDKMLADLVSSLADKIRDQDLPGEHDDLLKTMQDLGTAMQEGGAGGEGGGAGDAASAAPTLPKGVGAGSDGSEGTVTEVAMGLGAGETAAKVAMGLGGLVQWLTQKLAQIEGRLRETKACLDKCEEHATLMPQVGAGSGLPARRKKAVNSTKRLLLLQLSLSAVIEGGRRVP